MPEVCGFRARPALPMQKAAVSLEKLFVDDDPSFNLIDIAVSSRTSLTALWPKLAVPAATRGSLLHEMVSLKADIISIPIIECGTSAM